MGVGGCVYVYACVCLLATAMRGDFGFLCTLKSDKSRARAELEVAEWISKIYRRESNAK